MREARDEPRHVVAARERTSRTLWFAGAAIAALALASLMAVVLSRFPPRVELIAASGCGLLLIPALALVRYETAVALGFALLGVALVDPAPSDLVFVAVLAVAAVTGRFAVRGVPSLPITLILVLMALNMLSAVEVVEAAHAGAFFLTTGYLAVFALWVAAWTTTARRARIVSGGYIFAATTSATLGLLALVGPCRGEAQWCTAGGCRRCFKTPMSSARS